MCNRYTASQREAIKIYGREIIPHLFLDDWEPIYNIPPTSRVPVITGEQNHAGRLLHWGTQTVKGLVMNARSETLLEKSLWKGATEKRRCLMLADGFFEWETVGKRKLGHCFTLAGRKPFALAGVWFPANDIQPDRVVMVTCQPNTLVQPFHDRMPAILSTDSAREWLTAYPITLDTVNRLCQPYPVPEMDHWRSPPEMNSNAYQNPAAVLPWQPEPDLFA